MTPDRVIGRGGRLPWRLSADLKRFKQLTMGHTIVMGRKTYDSIGRPLPGRQSVVLTQRHDLVIPGAVVVHSLKAALQESGEDTEVFFVGGSQIYRETLPLVSRLYLTWVHAKIAGDTHFPPLNLENWEVLEEQNHPADAKNEFSSTFQILQRARRPGTISAGNGSS